MSHPASKRDGFTSSFGVLAATLGSAVGLGNIWKFPYLTGANGGASFLVVYLLATLIVGLPVMMAEIMLGRAARANAVSTFEKLTPGKRHPWWLVGLAGALAAFLVLAFYSEVAGWVFAYVFKSLTNQVLTSDPNVAGRVFESMITDPWQALLWQWAVLAFIGAIILMGVSKGIEAVTKRLMPVLFILLLVICVRSLTLPGASAGLEFLFWPDFSKLSAGVVLTALGLAFFKLSLGIGTMVTYGSYFRADQNIPATATRVMIADLIVSMLAGIAIFPAVFAFGFTPSAGPSLLFITIPAVFAEMPGGTLFVVLFFILTAIAATGAMLSILEVPIAVLTERFGWSRPLAVIVCVLLLAAVGSTAALSQSLLSGVRPFGMNFFDLYDYLSQNVLMPGTGIFIALFAGWVWGKSPMARELSNNGQLDNAWVVNAVGFLLRWVAPVLIAIVMAKGLGLF
ncbi:Transporter [Laribacter hongkongensis HLHK9]|uniref:Transporter n=1 Tax=Laribacter hongkongensis (strain HLHK9) TaxID=557598 RepID=C1D9V1_LARHH|nr:sodium-dependent transporter [Laribacter hongkongensis]ACO73064.1 Transporter [Laribacter hongkongensis HLHK9]